MNIKDSYLHGGQDIVKNITFGTNSNNVLTYTITWARENTESTTNTISIPYLLITSGFGTPNANLVFASPPSGDAGAPSFRSLVAADIPDISADKITTGTLGAGILPLASNSTKGAVILGVVQDTTAVAIGSNRNYGVGMTSLGLIYVNVPWTDTHYRAVPILGSSDDAVLNASSDTNNDTTYLNIIENDIKSGGILIVGDGSTTVKAKDGVLTISSTNTTYSGSNLIFLNNSGTPIDTYQPLTGSNKIFKAGDNIALTGSNNTITIAATNTYTYWGLQFTGTSIDGIMTFGANTFALSTDYTNTWSDGTNTHPWYGYDHRYANTGVYSTTISDYYGLTLKTYLGSLSITSDGKVGINNTTPSYGLHVSGSGMFTGHLYVGNATYTNSNFNDILTVGGSIRITGGSGSSSTGNYVRRIYFGDSGYAYIGEYCDEENEDYDSDSVDIYSNNALYLRCDSEVQILQNTEILGALTVSGNVSAPNLIKILTKAISNVTLDADTFTQANTLYRSLGDLNIGTNIVWSNWPDTQPSGGYSLINISEGNYNRQIAGLYDDNHLYVRSLIYNQGTVWKPWNKILLDSDTGHNNGLDADTIDGLHASNLVKLASTTATSLTNLDTSKSFIYATLSSSVTASAFTLSGTMSVGLVLTVLVLNNGSTTINITIPSTWKTLDDYTLAVGANKFIEISILCYASNSYIVSSKGQ